MPDTCIHGRRTWQWCSGCRDDRLALEQVSEDTVEAATVVGPLVYRVTIPGNPGACKVNSRATPIMRRGAKRPTMILSKAYKQWRDAATALMRPAYLQHLTRVDWPRAARGATDGGYGTGPLAVHVTAYWPSMHRIGPAAGTPVGDVDAVAKACLDALEHAAVIGKDAQITMLVCRKGYDRAAPRIEIEVRRA